MKCEKCNEREASFFWTATINGKTTQRHLCGECAQEEGFGEVLESSFDELFRDPFDMFGDFFGGGFLPSFGRSLLSPVMTMPRLRYLTGEAPAKTEEKTAEADGKNIPADAGAEIKTRRELNELRHQLKCAVKEENFEKAIELRDKIKKLEA